MELMKDWRGNPIQVVRSKGGVLAVTNPWNNVINTGVLPWPAPELIQKLYQSRQVRAFAASEREIGISRLGFYSDLQSLHSEDAVTWSFFGPLAYSSPSVRGTFVKELFKSIEIEGSSNNVSVWLWRRIPHPDDLVPGGPEIDFGIQTDDVFLLGEAKWRSSVARAQGVNRDKDQMTLRHEFCQKYGVCLLPGVRHFVILGLSCEGRMVPQADTSISCATLHMRDTTWQVMASIASHPCCDEVQHYLQWKTQNSKAV
jgi:hypothetical protein